MREVSWDEFDMVGNTCVQLATRMEMRRPRRVRLFRRALTFLNAAKKPDDESGLAFLGTKPGRPLSDMTLSKLVKELGYNADVHGFRTPFRTWAHERTNFPREVAEAALAHLSGDAVERAYSRSDVFQRRHKVMGAWVACLGEKRNSVVRIG